MGEENRLALADRALRDNPRAGQPLRWQDCDDVEVYDDEGRLLFTGPRYLRCSLFECRHLVTHGMVKAGGCWCGNRRLVVPLRLTVEEKSLLKRGYYPLTDWEQVAIQPTLPEHKLLGWGQDEFKRRNEA